ncbi:MAG: radical SAM family heme chaperone HemW [Actinobacteria bacterium]|nr:radical SAM family heme chaperone HemW [Actinomycetota bacterium]
MTPEDADRHFGVVGVYVHIPFCARICPYCDFAVVAGKDHLAPRYIEALVAEIGGGESRRGIGAVYVGGGTPSHVEPRLLGLTLEAVERRHGIASGAEVSVEANPEDFTKDLARGLVALGFTRVSFGAQSFDPVVLGYLGRRHTPEDITRSVETARTAGFGSVSVDLIYGSPVEDPASWEDTLARAVDLGTDHVSCYALTVEQGTPLGRSVASGEAAPDPDIQADRHELAGMRLSAAGLGRYEVSNWATGGHECRYNHIVWAQGEYLGYGASAHGHLDGVRYRNLRRLDAYIAAVERGVRPLAGEELLRGWDAEIDRLFVGLRRVVGVAEGPGTAALMETEEGQLLEHAGVVSRRGDRLVIDRPLLTDMVQRAVLGLPEPWAQAAAANNVSVDA